MTAELTNIFMRWEYWMTSAKYYALISAQSDNQGFLELYNDALQRSHMIQCEFEAELQKTEGES